MRSASAVATPVRAVLDLLFPPRCGGCRRTGAWLCVACRESIRWVRPADCPRCGRASAVAPCPMCAPGAPGLESLRAMAELDGPLREAVHRMKYEDRPQMAAAIIDACAARLGPGSPILVPVPLDPERRRSRGYNQAELLARALGRALGGEVLAALVRVAGTGSQVGRSGGERRTGHAEFAWRDGISAPAAIWLVDDVVTTGATLQACAVAARAAGVGRVDGVAVARG